MDLPVCNYIEYVPLYDSKYTIEDIMKGFLHLKGFIKEFKVQMNKNLIMENHNHKMIKIYSLNLLNSNPNYKKGICANYYEKEKKHYHSYSCSQYVDNEFYVRRVTFKSNDNIYINFDTEYKDDNTYNRIFVNYNHDKNQDFEYIENKIGSVLYAFSKYLAH